jgi:hypothetical protein
MGRPDGAVQWLSAIASHIPARGSVELLVGRPVQLQNVTFRVLLQPRQIATMVLGAEEFFH